MKLARDSLTGELHSLRQIYRMRAAELTSCWGKPGSKKKIAAILRRDMICPECHMPVFAYNAPAAGGMLLSGRVIGHPDGQILRTPGWSHYPHNRLSPESESVDCSLYMPVDPRLSNLVRTKPTPAIAEKVKEALTDPLVRRLNQEVLQKLWYAATKTSLTRDIVASYAKIAQKEHYFHEVFATHPTLLPYVLMLRTPLFDRVEDGQIRRFKYVGVGENYLTYRDIEGNERVTKVYKAMALVPERARGWHPRPEDRRFLIGLSAAYALSGLQEQGIPQPNQRQKPRLVRKTRIVGAQSQWLPGLSRGNLHPALLSG